MDKERHESSKQGSENQFKTPIKSSSPAKKTWNVRSNNVVKIKKSANKYSVRVDVEDNEPVNKEFVDKRLKVNRFILKRSYPSKEDTAYWTYDMKKYFKHNWIEVCRKENANDSESEDDLVEENAATDYLVADEIDIMDTGVLLN
nr:hypothetical protein [Tanacetum cinerariifolium]